VSLVEVLLILLVVAAASAALHAYLSETKKSLDTLSARRPLGHARLAGDLATLAAIRSQLDVYHATHGQWPPSRDAVAAVLRPAPRFQCAGNDYTYDPVSGQVGLVIADPGRC
jgi:hypothetical protein